MEVFQKMLAVLFPERKRCLICRVGIRLDGFCKNCWRKIGDHDTLISCRACGRYYVEVLPNDGNEFLCGECLNLAPPFFLARSAGPYRGILKDAIYLYKYQRNRSLSEPLGLMLADLFLREPIFTGVKKLVPVPLSAEKLAVRGFNQAELLAAKMGKILNLPVSTALIRARDTASQSKLARAERTENIAGAFGLEEELCAGFVLLVDDVLTTGATAAECARVLLRAGVGRVGVITLASGIQDKGQ